MSDPNPGPGGDILVVDDDADSRTFARVWLQRAGYTVREAENAEAALAAIARRPPDLILLDVRLPDLDGFEVTRRLRLDPALSTIPIVMVTALDDLQSKVKGLEAGANDLLTKPAQRSELLVRVRMLLRSKRDQEELLAEKNKTALLYRISRELAGELDLDTILPEVLELTTASIGASRGSIILLDELGGVLRHIFSHQGQAATVSDVVRGGILQKGLAGWVIQHREGAILPDTDQDPRWLTVPHTDLVTRSALAMPLIHQDQVAGVLTLTHEEAGRFTPADLDLLSSIAAQAAVALANARLFDTLKQERARLQAFLAATDNAIVATDRKGRITLINRAAERVFGVSLAQATGWPLEEVLAHEGVVEAFHNAREASAPVPPSVISLPNGRALFFQISSLETGPKSEGGWVAVMQDITHLKELDQLKSEFVSIVSHDLRTPLATIHGYADVLLRMVDGDGRECAEGIKAQARWMAQLVEELLDLGKIEAGLDSVRVPCQLGSIISEAVDAARFQAQSGTVALAWEVSSLSRPVLGNPVRLRQALDNLISNALKYTPAGGAVTVRAWEKEDRTVVTVQDNGIGIPREALPRIFEKFYRAPLPEKIKAAGTGLGLSIVKAIVEQYQGQVWVESELGRGSTFGFSLPCYDEP